MNKRRSAIVTGIFAVVAVVCSFTEMRKLWQDPVLGISREITFAQSAGKDDLVIKGFEPGDDGLYLSPQKVGQVVYRLRMEPPQPIAVEPSFNNISGGQKFRNRFAYSLDGGKTYITVAENRSFLSGQALVIPAAESETVLLKFDAANTTLLKAFVIQGFRYRDGVVAEPVPKLSQVLFGLGIGLLIFQLGLMLKWDEKRSGLAGVMGTACGSLFPATAPALGIVLLALGIVKWREYGSRKSFAIELPAIILVLALGAKVREASLEEYAHSPLTGDAVGYRQIALDMKLFSWKEGFYAPRWREPGFPFVAKLFFTFFGDSDLHHRMFSVLAGLAAMLLMWWIGREWGHPFIGLTGALLMATEKYLVFRSMYGYRLEVRTVLLLLFLYTIFSERKWQVRWRAAFIGLTGAMLILTELSTLPVVVLFIGWFLWTKRKEWRTAGIAPVLLLILLLPFLIRQTEANGHPLHPLTLHAKWYRNIETSEYQGYEGPPVSMLGYLFGEHSLNVLATGAFEGYSKYVTGMPFFKEQVMRILFVLGLILALAIPAHRRFAVWLLLINLPPVIFLYGQNILTEERVLVHAYPFAAWCAILPLFVLAEYFHDSPPKDNSV